MKPENAKKIWQMILDAGDYLKDKLPSHPSHPKGRNSYAPVSYTHLTLPTILLV